MVTDNQLVRLQYPPVVPFMWHILHAAYLTFKLQWYRSGTVVHFQMLFFSMYSSIITNSFMFYNGIIKYDCHLSVTMADL